MIKYKPLLIYKARGHESFIGICFFDSLDRQLCLVRGILKMLRHLMLISAALITACASPVANSTVGPETGITVDAEQTERGLPPQTLAPNECGLFLWSKTDTSKFVFFTRAGENEALFLLNDLPVTLQMTSQSGEVFGQFYTELKYKTESGQDVSLSYEAGELLTDGARIKNGIIQFTDEKNWLTVLPVLGVRVCQPVFPETSAPSSQSS